MEVEKWLSLQRELLDIERAEEVAQVQDKLGTLSAADCETQGLSILQLQVQSMKTSLFGRTGELTVAIANPAVCSQCSQCSGEAGQRRHSRPCLTGPAICNLVLYSCNPSPPGSRTTHAPPHCAPRSSATS
jgi:hypothetical protein